MCAPQVEPCCKRRSITEIAKQFPGVDFSLIETDKDTWWNEDRRELDDEVQVLCWGPDLKRRFKLSIQIALHSAIGECEVCWSVVHARAHHCSLFNL